MPGWVFLSWMAEPGAGVGVGGGPSHTRHGDLPCNDEADAEDTHLRVMITLDFRSNPGGGKD